MALESKGLNCNLALTLTSYINLGKTFTSLSLSFHICLPKATSLSCC